MLYCHPWHSCRRSAAEGGATAFPHARLPGGSQPAKAQKARPLIESWAGRVPGYCKEGAGMLQVAPEPGDAAIFWWVLLLWVAVLLG